MARIKDNSIYQSEISPDFIPFRRDADYLECKQIPIQPLIEQLHFIENKKSWGFKFRYGLFEIPAEDFNLIASEMKVRF